MHNFAEYLGSGISEILWPFRMLSDRVLHLVLLGQLIEVLRVAEGRVQREEDVQGLDLGEAVGNPFFIRSA